MPLCCKYLFRKAVEQLVGGRENQVVLFGGTSAGGRGSMVSLVNINNVTMIVVSFQVLVDFLQELLHPSTEVRGLHDSGAYQVRILDFRANLSQDILPYNPDYYPFGDQCHE